MRSIFTLLAAITLFSCSKSDAPANPDPLGPPVLHKIFLLDTTQTAPYDTLGMTSFDYDHQGRVVKATSWSFHPPTWVYSPRYAMHYYYNGTDTLPYKAWEDKSGVTAFPRSWTHLLSYDAQHRLVKDSSMDVALNTHDSSIYKHKYLYRLDGHVDSTIGHKPAYSEYAEDVFLQRDAQNRITQSTTMFGNMVITNIQYDNHANPLYKVSPVKVPYLENDVYPCFIGRFTPQPGNFKKVTSDYYDASGTTILSTTVLDYHTTYNPSGLPASIRIRSTPASMNDKYKWAFKY